MSARDRIQDGQDLRGAREALGLTINELAAQLRMNGVHATRHLREMELGTRDLAGPVAVAVGYMLELADA